MDAPVAQPRRKRVADLTGLKIWPCSHHVLAHLEANLLPRLAASSNSPLRILELGAGTGALGISLGVSPAPTRVVVTDPAIDVHFADSTSNTLDWLRANVEINPVGERVVARKLLWGDSADTEAVLNEQIWPDADAGFDVVLGSDLLYNPDEYEGLVKTLVPRCAARRSACSATPTATMAKSASSGCWTSILTSAPRRSTAASRFRR